MRRGAAWPLDDWEPLRFRLAAGASCQDVVNETGWPLGPVKKAAAKIRKGVERPNFYAGSKKSSLTTRIPSFALLQRSLISATVS